MIFVPYHFVRIGILRKKRLGLHRKRKISQIEKQEKAHTEVFLGVFEKLTEFLLSILLIFTFFFIVDPQAPTISSELSKNSQKFSIDFFKFQFIRFVHTLYDKKLTIII
jgi:hypothetical protein